MKGHVSRRSLSTTREKNRAGCFFIGGLTLSALNGDKRLLINLITHETNQTRLVIQFCDALSIVPIYEKHVSACTITMFRLKLNTQDSLPLKRKSTKKLHEYNSKF